MNMLYKIFAVLAFAAAYVAAEQHVVSFNNRSVASLTSLTDNADFELRWTKGVDTALLL